MHTSKQSKKKNKQKKQTMQQIDAYMYSSNLRQWKMSDEFCFYVYKNVQNSEMFPKYFILHICCGSLFTSFFSAFYLKDD